MSKILKRPMFRIGGSANDGIMSMAVPKRAGYQEPTGAATTLDNYKIDPNDPLYKDAMRNAAMMSQFAGSGRSERDRALDLLLRGSIRLGSERPAGNIFSTAAKAFQEPVDQYIKSGEAEDAFQRQLKLAGLTSAMTSADAEKLARLKLKGENEEAIIKLKGDELKAIGSPPGLARVMTDYEKRTGEKVFPLPINPADPRGYTAKELSQIPPDQTFINNKGDFFKKLESGKVVQINPNTNTVIEPKVVPKEKGFFEKLLTPPQENKPNPYITSKQRFYEEYYRNNPGKRPQQDMG
jgi:hypothetical protein